MKVYEKVRKITSQGDNYKIGCLLNYNYFKNYYKMIAIAILRFFTRNCQSIVKIVVRRSNRVLFCVNIISI